MNKKLRGNLMLLLTAFIWGAAFVAQRSGMDYIEPFTFNGIRSFIGGIALIPVILLMSRKRPAEMVETPGQEPSDEEKRRERKTLVTGGIACGVVLFVASSLQQVGLAYTTAGKAGFITALYIVLVPITGIFIGKKVRPILWLCVAMAVIGLYLLCVQEGFSLNKGDFLMLLCAFGFTVHILVIDYFSPKTDGVKMSCIQFFVCGAISIIPMATMETVVLADILACWLPLVYAGALSCGVGYTLQIVAQKDANPTIAAMLLSLESVFAVISGSIILHEQMAVREIIGCVIMFAAIIIAQLPSREERLAAKDKSGWSSEN